MKKTLFFVSTFVFTQMALMGQSPVWSSDSNDEPLGTDAVAFSADGSQVMSGSECEGARLRIFSAADGTMQWTIW